MVIHFFQRKSNKPKDETSPHLEPRSPWAQNGTPCIDVYSMGPAEKKNTPSFERSHRLPKSARNPFQTALLVRLFANVVQSLESELNGLLGKLRETAGTGAMKALPWVNRYEVLVLLFLAALAGFFFLSTARVELGHLLRASVGLLVSA